MSLFKGILGAVAPIVGGMFGGPAGAAIGAAIGGAINQPRTMTQGGTAMPGIGFNGPSFALPPVGPIVAAGGRVVVAGARSAMQGAIAWCRRNPAWCSSIGGTAAVAAMIESGQLPAPKRRRGRGLSSRDLRGFRKTVRLIRATAGSVGLRGRARSRGGTSSTMITQN